VRPLLIEGFCDQGGSAEGYYRAGFDIVGVDIRPQPRFPFPFIQGDAIEVMGNLLARGRSPVRALAGSPPCQAWSETQRLMGNDHPDYIPQTRELFKASGLPYIIENVVGAPLENPVLLCGAMFPELNVYRHRLFECSWKPYLPVHPEHVQPQTKMGRKLQPGERMHVVGNFSGVEDAKKAMGIDWMTRDGLREAIPPAFTQYLGKQLLSFVNDEQPERCPCLWCAA
jgi:DNA (cytosine-5)-methyltransferase 1